MSLVQFLKRLKRLRSKVLIGTFRHSGTIRLYTADRTGRFRQCCPIDAVGGDYGEDDGGLGFRRNLRECIVYAADDGASTSYRKRIRREMIRALGLQS